MFISEYNNTNNWKKKQVNNKLIEMSVWNSMAEYAYDNRHASVDTMHIP